LNITDFSALIGAVTGLVSLVSVVYLAAVKLTRIEVKVDTMWEFQRRRGISEAVRGGWGEFNSPFVPSPKAVALLKPLAPHLKATYNERRHEWSDIDLMVAIERRFGDRIVKDVCIPTGLHDAACLAIAVEIAKGSVPIDIEEGL